MSFLQTERFPEASEKAPNTGLFPSNDADQVSQPIKRCSSKHDMSDVADAKITACAERFLLQRRRVTYFASSTQLLKLWIVLRYETNVESWPIFVNNTFSGGPKATANVQITPFSQDHSNEGKCRNANH